MVCIEDSLEAFTWEVTSVNSQEPSLTNQQYSTKDTSQEYKLSINLFQTQFQSKGLIVSEKKIISA